MSSYVSSFCQCLPFSCAPLIPHTHTAFIIFPDEGLSKVGFATKGIKAQGSFTNYSLILALKSIHQTLWSENGDQFLLESSGEKN